MMAETPDLTSSAEVRPLTEGDDAHEAALSAVYDKLAGGEPEKPRESVAAVEEDEEAVEPEAPDEAAEDATEPEETHTPSPEYEEAKKRLAFVKMDPEKMGLTEEQAIAFAQALRDKDATAGRTMQELAELRKQYEALQVTADAERGEQKTELGRPTVEPTPAPTVDVRERLAPIADSLGLTEEESDTLADLIGQGGSAKALQAEVAQLRSALQDLGMRELRRDYGERFPKATADPKAFEALLTKAQALHATDPEGDFEEALRVVYQGLYGAGETGKQAAKPQRKPSSTPVKSRAPADKPAASREEALAEVYDRMFSS